MPNQNIDANELLLLLGSKELELYTLRRELASSQAKVKELEAATTKAAE